MRSGEVVYGWYLADGGVGSGRHSHGERGTVPRFENVRSRSENVDQFRPDSEKSFINQRSTFHDSRSTI
jgi:hypothetical protein